MFAFFAAKASGAAVTVGLTAATVAMANQRAKHIVKRGDDPVRIAEATPIGHGTGATAMLVFHQSNHHNLALKSKHQEQHEHKDKQAAPTSKKGM